MAQNVQGQWRYVSLYAIRSIFRGQVTVHWLYAPTQRAIRRSPSVRDTPGRSTRQATAIVARNHPEQIAGFVPGSSIDCPTCPVVEPGRAEVGTSFATLLPHDTRTNHTGPDRKGDQPDATLLGPGIDPTIPGRSQGPETGVSVSTNLILVYVFPLWIITSGIVCIVYRTIRGNAP